MELTEQQIQRYSRHIILQDVGGKGQLKLSKAKVLLIGAGGLGSPAALYLAAAGIGTIGLVDGDVVDLSNLQRQILHTTATLGQPKVESGRKTLSAINPDITIKTYHQLVDAENILALVCRLRHRAGRVRQFHHALSGQRRLLLCQENADLRQHVPLRRATDDHQAACRAIPAIAACIPSLRRPGLVPNCQEAGVLGVLAGTMGILQASEAIKEILGIGETLADKLLIYDALEMKFRKVGRPKDPALPALRRHIRD